MTFIDKIIITYDRLMFAVDQISHYGQLADGHVIHGVVWWVGYLVYFIILAAAYGLQVLLTPKPPVPKPASLNDFDFPTADQSRPIPVIFGTVTITGPNVIWYGDLFADPIPAPGGKK